MLNRIINNLFIALAIVHCLNVEAFATTTAFFHIWIFKFESFLQAFFGVIHLRAI